MSYTFKLDAPEWQPQKQAPPVVRSRMDPNEQFVLSIHLAPKIAALGFDLTPPVEVDELLQFLLNKCHADWNVKMNPTEDETQYSAMITMSEGPFFLSMANRDSLSEMVNAIIEVILK